ncbi:MAG: hypothetical protein EBT99_13630 [Betaproteobacteria bacterium]|nr:hypothetical protein [Betaproteobacteria bacterium]
MQAAIAQSFGESDHPTKIDHGCDLIFLHIDCSQREMDVVFAGLGLMHWADFQEPRYYENGLSCGVLPPHRQRSAYSHGSGGFGLHRQSLKSRTL